MPTTDWLYPTTTGTHAGSGSSYTGTGVWYATTRIKAADGSSTYIGPDGTNLTNGQVTEWLRAEQFAPSIPSNAVVIGLEIRLYIRRKTGAAQLTRMMLTRGGKWLTASLREPKRTLSGSYELLTYGGERDKWGLSLDRAMATDSTFGVRIQCTSQAAGTNIDIDYVQARFHYTQTQTIATVANADTDYSAGITTARLGTVTVETTAVADIESVQSASAVLSGLSAAVSAIYDIDAVSGPSSVILSDYLTFAAQGPCIDYDYAAAVTASLGSITLQQISGYDIDNMLQVGSIVYTSVTATGTVAFDIEAVNAAVARYATRLTGIAPCYDIDVQLTGLIQVIWSVLVLHRDFLRNSQQSQIQAFPLLVTITHKDLPSPLRFTDAGDTVVSRGESYLALPVTITLPSNGRNERAEGSIVLPIQSRQVRGIFRTLTGKPATVRIEMVRGSDTDIVEETWVMRLAATETGQNVVLALNDGDFESRQFPPLIFDGRWQAVHD